MDMVVFIIGAILLLITIAAVLAGLRLKRTNAGVDEPNRDSYPDGYAGDRKFSQAQEKYYRAENEASDQRKAASGAFFLAIGTGIVGAGLVLLGFTTQVPAQNVGVVTEWGKPLNRNLEAGLHWKMPWQKVTDMDGTIQQVNNTPRVDGQDPAKNTENPRGLTEVRLDTGVVIYVENTLRWRIKQEGASQLFLDWKEFSRIDPGLVDKELKSALNVALADYDPYVADSDVKEDVAKAESQSRDNLSEEVKTRLESRIGTQVDVVGFNIIKLDVDEKTQANIQALQASRAETKKAEQDEKTAEVRARTQANTNAQLAESLAKNPGVLVDKCLDIIRENGKAVEGEGHGGLPATLNCNFLTNDGKDVTLTQSTN